MKLRTEVYETNGGLRIDTTRADAEHDALCAHALMLAMRCEEPGVYARAIAKAESILREWGFDSGEDA